MEYGSVAGGFDAIEAPYRADVWYWKAYRTDLGGYADGKSHIYNQKPDKRAKQIVSPQAKIFYLLRLGDHGQSSYSNIPYGAYQGAEVPRYRHRQPTGSRADIRAKGRWHNGTWTVEFCRQLDTGHPDDVQFYPLRRYRFGVSRHEIAGKLPNPQLDQPYYESGKMSEYLTLIFQP